jgi:hypothetical protein
LQNQFSAVSHQLSAKSLIPNRVGFPDG